MENQIKTISICVLIDTIFPGYWDKQLYTQMSYDTECKAVTEWCEDNNYFLYERCDKDFFEWEGIQLAGEGPYVGVVLSNLS